MKFAICNEMFGDMPFGEVCRLVRSIGYTGIELAPFTLTSDASGPFDVRSVTHKQLAMVREQANSADLSIIGLHWLLAKTEGLHLTAPDSKMRTNTAEYLSALASCCSRLGGSILVLGSPQQRNLLPGVTHADGARFAMEVLQAAVPTCERTGVTIAIEPLGPAEGNFLNTIEVTEELIEKVDSPHVRLHLDVKAMATEQAGIAELIHASRGKVAHVHANDATGRGPGLGLTDFTPILQALVDTGYSDWVSVEPFCYEPTPEEVARKSWRTLEAATRYS